MTGVQSDLEGLGVMVGLEIHQQLATGKKLFCSCAPGEPDEYSVKFSRKLRSASGELGAHDPAALFESARAKTITYYANYNSSCLVEQDEEPPHGLDEDAKRTAMIIASALKSRIYTELHAMRKTVVDGSNTTGFQRTMLVAEGGVFDVRQDYNDDNAAKKQTAMTVGIQSICLEEDAAKILDAGSQPDVTSKGYGLERLGIPLVEIATGPFFVSDARVVREVAHTLGRILRSTRMVTRGLGSIRQDVNVSIAPSQAAKDRTVVEVKGVQQLDQLADVVSYEAHRQHGLLKISERLKGWMHDASDDRAGATGALKACESKIIQKAIKNGHTITAVAFRGLHGIFGYSPYEGVRLGKDIAELVRLFGVGGVFHSDELPAYGISQGDVDAVSELLHANDNDAFLLFAAPGARVRIITDQIISRVCKIATDGIPADTRLATHDGKTAFLRPRPGAARMYPETDVPTIVITKDEIDAAALNVPKPWHEAVSGLQSTYMINAQLAEQLWDSPYLETFKRIAAKSIKDNNTEHHNITSPAFVASILCSTITNLERHTECDIRRLNESMIQETFDLLEMGKIAKESVEIILQGIMSGEAKTVDDAIKSASIQNIDESELKGVIEKIIRGNVQMIKNQGERAAGPIMGMVMKELRGKAPGSTINALVVSGIADVLGS